MWRSSCPVLFSFWGQALCLGECLGPLPCPECVLLTMHCTLMVDS